MNLWHVHSQQKVCCDQNFSTSRYNKNLAKREKWDLVYFFLTRLRNLFIPHLPFTYSRLTLLNIWHQIILFLTFPLSLHYIFLLPIPHTICIHARRARPVSVFTRNVARESWCTHSFIHFFARPRLRVPITADRQSRRLLEIQKKDFEMKKSWINF